MKNRDILNAMGDIDFDMIEDAGRVTRKTSLRRKVARWSSLAACVCVAVAVLALVLHYGDVGRYVDTDVYEGDVIYGTLSDQGEGNASTMYHLPFEQVCKAANDVVSAIYLGGWIEDGKCFLEFEVLECHKGDVDEQKIVVRWKQSAGDIYNMKMAGAYGTAVRIPFMKGKSYLLLLNHLAASAYDDEYYSSCTLVIPLNQIHNSTIYDEPLSKQMENPRAMKNVNRLIRYVKKLAKNTPNIAEDLVYIESDDLADVIRGSSYVLKVRVEKKGVFPCFVVAKVYKGDLKEQDDISLRNFSNMEIKEGNEWIVILEKKYGCYYFTSREGALDVSREEEIIELLDVNE